MKNNINFLYIFLPLIVLIGGILNHIARLKNGSLRKFDIWVLSFDLLLAVFIAMIVYSACKGLNINEWFTVVFVAVSVKRELGFFTLAETVIFKIFKIKIKKD